MAGKRRTKGTGTLFKKNNGRYALRYEDIDGKIKTVTLKNQQGKPVTLRNDAVKVNFESFAGKITLSCVLNSLTSNSWGSTQGIDSSISQISSGVQFRKLQILKTISVPTNSSFDSLEIADQLISAPFCKSDFFRPLSSSKCHNFLYLNMVSLVMLLVSYR